MSDIGRWLDGHGLGKYTELFVENEIDIEVLPELDKRIGALWSLANIATLIGLLGTISGLIRAFGAVAFADPSEQQRILSNGISEAMYNTALGLGIAVLCMIAHLILHSMAKKQKQDMERATMKLENLIALRRQG